MLLVPIRSVMPTVDVGSLVGTRRSRARQIPDPRGLLHPEDLEDWRAWQRRGRPVHQRLRHHVDAPTERYVLTTGGPDAQIVIALEGATPSTVAAVEQPIRFLDSARVAVLDRRARRDLLGPQSDACPIGSPTELLARLPEVRTGLTIGAHLPIGALIHRAIDGNDKRCFVAQHGLLTPFAPPLPPRSELLAWSVQDGEFWSAGRADVSAREVGSQLLWDAAQLSVDDVAPDDRPVFLGQLHAAEFPRNELARASLGFCSATGARYRPHPAEVDRLSRLYHMVWKRRGVEFDLSRTSLTRLASPVVSVFSGGLVEAAAAGIPAWAYHPDPPAWLSEFWDRNGIRCWGEEASPAPVLPAVEPARRTAEYLHDHADGQEAS